MEQYLIIAGYALAALIGGLGIYDQWLSRSIKNLGRATITQKAAVEAAEIRAENEILYGAAFSGTELFLDDEVVANTDA